MGFGLTARAEAVPNFLDGALVRDRNRAVRVVELRANRNRLQLAVRIARRSGHFREPLSALAAHHVGCAELFPLGRRTLASELRMSAVRSHQNPNHQHHHAFHTHTLTPLSHPDPKAKVLEERPSEHLSALTCLCGFRQSK